MSYEEMTRKILQKMDSRTRIGWIDYSRGSLDYSRAELRAHRVIMRARGVRTDKRGEPK